MTPLEQSLIQEEQQHSHFENQRRHAAVPTLSLFKTDPEHICFEPSSLNIPASGKQSDSVFPGLAARQDQIVLRAKKGATAIKNKRIAVLFSGGPASGGHNVVAGIQHALGKHNQLLGVLAGPKGLLEGRFVPLSASKTSTVVNLGGFDLLGSDRTKISTPEQFETVRRVVKNNTIDGIIVVGGDDSNTNAAFLAESLLDLNCAVIGVPKTIDGDLQLGHLLPISFGFDTATKIYSEMVGNILQDTPSSRKYWHVIKLMGRSASHVALEVALQTRPPLTLISEEIRDKKLTLNQVIDRCVEVVVARAKKGKHYGVILVPEGLIEFIPELNQLIAGLNDCIGRYGSSWTNLSFSEQKEICKSTLQANQKTLFFSLPEAIQKQLLLERDSHGNVQVSQIPTEALLIDMIQERLDNVEPAIPFSPIRHFFGYEGRCGAPSAFDASYTFNLGLIAGALALTGQTGYMAALSELNQGGRAYGLPLTAFIQEEQRKGKPTWVIEKALVKLESPAFRYFQSRRDHWVTEDSFSSPGPRQFSDPHHLTMPITVALNQGYQELSFTIK